MNDEKKNGEKSYSENSNSNNKSSIENTFLSSFKRLISKYRPIIWNLILFFTGTYLVWSTLSVLLTILGFIIGIFFILFSLNELKILRFVDIISGLVKMLKF